jgi:hypothetical protein
MNRFLTAAALVVTSFASTGAILAQDRQLQATIPFNFAAGRQVLPAGQYRIAYQQSNVIRIESADGKKAILALVQTDEGGKSDSNKLVFYRYGDQYFLHQIHCTQAGVDVALPLSGSERRAREEEVAKLHSVSRTYVALK